MWCGVVGVVLIVLPLHISDEGGWLGVQVYFPNERVNYFEFFRIRHESITVSR